MRLAPLTDDLPTCLLYLPGATILDYLFHHLSLLPISKTTVVLQYRGDQVARHLAEHHSDKAITPIPQYAPFTLLSALASAAPQIEEPTLVLHGNYFFSHDLRYFIEQADPSRPTFLLSPEDAEAGRVRHAGAYLLPPEAFYVAAQLTKEVGLDAPVAAMREEGFDPAFCSIQGWARCIRTPADLLTVNRYLLTHWHEVTYPPAAGIGYDAINFSWIAPDADIDRSVQSLFVTIAPKVTVRNSRLYNTLLLPGVRLEDGREQNAVLARHANSLLRLYGATEEPVMAR
jgi:NDP-sugar pyrophosphorylase family protein